MAYNKEMTFTLGKNDKGDNPKRPDYRGELMLGGQTFELAGWIRTRQSDGSKFISGTLKLKVPKQAQPVASEAERPKEEEKPFAPAAQANVDEDVPF